MWRKAPGPSRRLWLAAAGAALVLPVAPGLRAGEDPAQAWRVRTDASRLVIHVQPAGLLSPALQSHHFSPADWHGSVCFDPDAVDEAALDVVVLADSLENDQPALSEEDAATVDRQVRSDEVLDVASHPEIRVAGRGVRAGARLDPDEHGRSGLEGTLEADVTIRGVTQAIDLPFTLRWDEHHLSAAGKTGLRQTDFGIEPYSRFLGTVAIQDEVEIEFSIAAVPDRIGTEACP